MTSAENNILRRNNNMNIDIMVRNSLIYIMIVTFISGVNIMKTRRISLFTCLLCYNILGALCIHFM